MWITAGSFSWWERVSQVTVRRGGGNLKNGWCTQCFLLIHTRVAASEGEGSGFFSLYSPRRWILWRELIPTFYYSARLKLELDYVWFALMANVQAGPDSLIFGVIYHSWMWTIKLSFFCSSQLSMGRKTKTGKTPSVAGSSCGGSSRKKITKPRLNKMASMADVPADLLTSCEAEIFHSRLESAAKQMHLNRTQVRHDLNHGNIYTMGIWILYLSGTVGDLNSKHLNK